MICLLKSLIEVSALLIFYFNHAHIASFLTLFLVNQMSTRVDALEASIQDIINGDVVSVPQSPAAQVGTSGAIRWSLESKLFLCISSLLREFALYYVGRKRIIIVSYESWLLLTLTMRDFCLLYLKKRQKFSQGLFVSFTHSTHWNQQRVHREGPNDNKRRSRDLSVSRHCRC